MQDNLFFFSLFSQIKLELKRGKCVIDCFPYFLKCRVVLTHQIIGFFWATSQKQLVISSVLPVLSPVSCSDTTKTN